MLLEVIRYAADRIDRIPQVDMPVAVKVHRVLPVRRGKLTVTHRAGEGAFQIERVILFARHQQERFQLAGEVFARRG